MPETMLTTDHCRWIALQYKSPALHGSAQFTTVHITTITRQFTAVYYYHYACHHSSPQCISTPLHRLFTQVYYYWSKQYRSSLLPLQFTAVHTDTTDNIEVHLGALMMDPLMRSGSTWCGTRCSQRYVISRNIRRCPTTPTPLFRRVPHVINSQWNLVTNDRWRRCVKQQNGTSDFLSDVSQNAL